MKRPLMILATLTLAIPALAQTNPPPRPPSDLTLASEPRKGSERNYGQRRREMSPEEKEERNERRLQLMEKTLENIGVTEEQRLQILDMQQRHKEKIKAVSQKVDDARKKLSELEKANAPEEKIYAAIDEMSEAQAEQLKVLTRNRMEMERILGKEKYQQFMEAARNQYRKYGRRGGSGLPPRPDFPPRPGAENRRNDPPMPDF